MINRKSSNLEQNLILNYELSFKEKIKLINLQIVVQKYLKKILPETNLKKRAFHKSTKPVDQYYWKVNFTDVRSVLVQYWACFCFFKK